MRKFRSSSTLIDAELNDTLRKFWELEHIGILSLKRQFTPYEKSAWKKSQRIENLWWETVYQVAIPCKEERPRLINNRPLAERRLQQFERKLVKDKKAAAAYQQTIEDYLQKNYIGRVPPTKKKMRRRVAGAPFSCYSTRKINDEG